MTLLSQGFLNTVVAIGIEDEKRDKYWIATGFFYGKFHSKINEVESDYNTYLITNKHVLLNQKKILIRCNPKNELNAKEFEINLYENNKEIWTSHTNDNIDVAVISVNFTFLKNLEMDVEFFQENLNTAGIDKLIELGVSEGDLIYILGFPMGLTGGIRNNVVVRLGCISQIQNTLKKLRMEFLIDASIFPGNSGSPVLLRPEIASIMGTTAINTSFLIGIVKSYLPYKDTAVSSQTGKIKLVSEENSNLAEIIPIDFINETINEDLEKKNK